jgi:hypothetical protein
MRRIWRQNAQASTQAGWRRGIDDARAYERGHDQAVVKLASIRIWLRAMDFTA